MQVNIYNAEWATVCFYDDSGISVYLPRFFYKLLVPSIYRGENL